MFASLRAQTSGRVEGRVVLQSTGAPLHNVSVLLVQTGKVAETDRQGFFAMSDIPPGTYDIVAYTGPLNSPTQLVRVSAGETTQINLTLAISPIKQEITVTATGSQETAFDTVQSVSSLDSYDLGEKLAPSVGEVLDGQLGVAKRSFGPGTSRPVVRGFDGDRVLVLQDGIELGSLGSQSGDHGEPIDTANIERLEVVKGPATLLYGSNAIGGVVNAVTGHFEEHQQPHPGLRGQFTGVAGSNNGHGGASVRAEYGLANWLFWGGGGGQRTGDYSTPAGSVDNSKSRISNLSAGLGYQGERANFSFGYAFNDGRYGIPFAAEFGEEGHGSEGEPEEELSGIDIAFRRHNVRWTTGIQQLGSGLDSFKFSLTYTDWNHRELEGFADGTEEVGTNFDNRQWVYRGVFQQKPGRLSGSFGFWGLWRDYDVFGAEAIAPPVDERAFAVFALEEVELERVKIQFGGRLEWTDYEPQEEVVRPQGLVLLPGRNFTSASVGVGARFDLWPKGAFVANFTSSHRAPSLEELYNFGPHLGNLAFEIGNVALSGERSNGLDLELRHHGSRMHVGASFFYYGIRDFVFLGPTGGVEEGLVEAEYEQGDSRFVGAEFRYDVAVHDSVWIKLGLDAVDAQLESGQPLPRIPPLRGRLGLDLRRGNLSVRPELVVTSAQEALFVTEERTAGYAVVNLKAAYTRPSQHFVHQFAVDFFNIGDRLYRNHLSFIKELAPEIGRGVRFSYLLKFF